MVKSIQRKYIDWVKTAKNLKLLRQDNINLRRYVCGQLYYGKRDCAINCEVCTIDMDHSISQNELAQVFNVSESMVANWENNKSCPHIDDLIFYSQVCGIDLFDVIVFVE